MKGNVPIAFTSLALVVVLAAQAQDVKTPYPNMAPLDQYLMERDAEVRFGDAI